MTCCLLRIYSAVGYLAGLLRLDPPELLLSVSHSSVGSTPTSLKFFGAAKGSVVDVEVAGRDCGTSTCRLKTFSGGPEPNIGFATLDGKRELESV
jgi:hypothetical protein